MATCIHCGKELEYDNIPCPDCGTTAQTPAPVPIPPTPEAPDKQSKYALISTLGYVGILLLIAIPVVGPILMIVWALGGCRKLQKRNFARANLLLALVSLLLTVIIVFSLVNAVRDTAEDLGLPRDAQLEEIIEAIVAKEFAAQSEQMIEDMMEDMITDDIPMTQEDINAMNEIFGAFAGQEGGLTEEQIGDLFREFEKSGPEYYPAVAPAT